MDPTVKTALEKFQEYGNTSGMSAAEEKALKDYFAKPTEYQAFLDWVFKGPSGKVDYLLLHSYERDDKRVCCHTMIYNVSDYMALVKKLAKEDAGFGTGLVWTYKSIKKRSGKKRNEIQLKVPLFFAPIPWKSFRFQGNWKLLQSFDTTKTIKNLRVIGNLSYYDEYYHQNERRYVVKLIVSRADFSSIQKMYLEITSINELFKRLAAKKQFEVSSSLYKKELYETSSIYE